MPRADPESAASAAAAPPPPAGSARYVMAGLLWGGLASLFGVRAVTAATMPEMEAGFGWDHATAGILLSAFFWGYVAGQLPGGALAPAYGGKRVFGGGIIGAAALSALIPVAARHFNGAVLPLFLLQAAIGFFAALPIPALQQLITEWAPAPERALLLAVANSGINTGTALSLLSCGAVVAQGGTAAWPTAFVLWSSIGVLWGAAWAFAGADTPKDSWLAEDSERAYLLSTTKAVQASRGSREGVVPEKSASPPWRGFCTTPCALTLYATHFVFNWTYFTILTLLPKFLVSGLHISLASAGPAAVLPFIVGMASQLAAGRGADWLITSGTLSVRSTRLLMVISSFVLRSITLVLASFATSTATALFYMCLCVGFSSVSFGGGWTLNYLDLSPHYAAPMYSIGNMIGNFAGVLAPVAAGYILNAGPAGGGWRSVFMLAAAVDVVGCVIWATGMKVQPHPDLN